MHMAPLLHTETSWLFKDFADGMDGVTVNHSRKDYDMKWITHQYNYFIVVLAKQGWEWLHIYILNIYIYILHWLYCLLIKVLDIPGH